MMKILALIKPRVLSFRNSGGENGKRGRLALFGAIGSIFWIGIFAVTYRVLSYFQGVKGFGDILAYKLLSMVILTFFSLLVFSAILTILSKLYLSKDLMLVHSLPVSAETIFMARWIESTADSAWMVVIYTIPVFLSYGIVYEAGFLFLYQYYLGPDPPVHQRFRFQRPFSDAGGHDTAGQPRPQYIRISRYRCADCALRNF